MSRRGSPDGYLDGDFCDPGTGPNGEYLYLMDPPATKVDMLCYTRERVDAEIAQKQCELDPTCQSEGCSNSNSAPLSFGLLALGLLFHRRRNLR